ncbi:MAG: hypothetical protein LBB21_01475 [Holosporaceae bacterium]|jgi:hypothetical protein|nr:hypothetical protein [Holosporaceae bacterium]
MNLKSDKTVTVVLLWFGLLCFNSHATVFDLIIIDHLDTRVVLSPIVDASALQLEGKIVVHPSSVEKVLPTLSIREGGGDNAVIIAKDELKEIAVEIGDINFSSVGLAKKDSIVHRLELKEEGGSIVGYLSFRCSVYNTNPGITIEPMAGYAILEEKLSFGGGSAIRIVVKKKD